MDYGSLKPMTTWQPATATSPFVTGTWYGGNPGTPDGRMVASPGNPNPTWRPYSDAERTPATTPQQVPGQPYATGGNPMGSMGSMPGDMGSPQSPQTYAAGTPAPQSLYSNNQTSGAMNRIRGQGAQAAATALMPTYRQGVASTSPTSQWGRMMNAGNVLGDTMQAMGQQYLSDQQANAANRLAGEQLRLGDVLGQAGSAATLGQLNSAYQGNMANQLLTGLMTGFNNLGQQYQEQIGDNTFWNSLGLRQNASNQANAGSGLDWINLLGGLGSSYGPTQSFYNSLFS